MPDFKFVCFDKIIVNFYQVPVFVSVCHGGYNGAVAVRTLTAFRETKFN